MSGFNDVIDQLSTLIDDGELSKAAVERVNKIIGFLKVDDGLAKDRALSEIEGLLEENGLPAYSRTEVWNIASMLESY